MSQPLRIVLELALALLYSTAACAGTESRTVMTPDGTEIDAYVHLAAGPDLVLWLYSEAGPQPVEEAIAEDLAARGVEVWRVDLLGAHFLPISASSMDQVPDGDFAALIEQAHRQTGKRVFPVATGRGVVPVLRGARRWQADHPDGEGLGGVILLSPKFYVETPEPGVRGELMPVVNATNLPVFIIQAEQSPWFWKLNETIPALERGGSDVFVQRLKKVRDRFYFRPDADAEEQNLTRELPRMLVRAIGALRLLPHTRRPAATPNGEAARPVIGVRKEHELKPYRGDPDPPALNLASLEGGQISLEDYRGQVVLVNFWASWCPPCVHEMPSMQRVQERLGERGFTIIGVNMAEDADTVRHFLATRVRVGFPIALDSDGDALRRWGVFAFPTSYVLDRQGKIRYALFGSVDWETPDILDRLRGLLATREAPAGGTETARAGGG